MNRQDRETIRRNARLAELEAKAEAMRAMLLKADYFLASNLDHAKAAELHAMIRKTLESCS